MHSNLKMGEGEVLHRAVAGNADAYSVQVHAESTGHHPQSTDYLYRQYRLQSTPSSVHRTLSTDSCIASVQSTNPKALVPVIGRI